VHGGKTIYVKGFGLADIQQNVPAEPSTRFTIASLTKQFTVASVLLLAQHGKLALDDRLVQYLPSFPNALRTTYCCETEQSCRRAFGSVREPAAVDRNRCSCDGACCIGVQDRAEPREFIGFDASRH
jgi:hypothetical protein